MIFALVFLIFLFVIFNFVIDFFSGIIDLFVFLYKNFSFPLLFLIIIFLFRKEISDLLKRIRQISFESDSGKTSFYFARMIDINSEMKSDRDFQIREYGEDLRYTQHLGFGPGSERSTDFKYYFGLIYASGKMHKELAQKGPFETIKNLHDAYFYLTTHLNLKGDNPTRIIQKYYDNATELKNIGGRTLNEEFVYDYRDYIELSLNGINKRLGLEPKTSNKQFEEFVDEDDENKK